MMFARGGAVEAIPRVDSTAARGEPHGPIALRRTARRAMRRFRLTILLTLIAACAAQNVTARSAERPPPERAARTEKKLRGVSVDFRHGALRVSPDGRSLVHADGARFFYLGDTAWELIHRLTGEETDFYLEDRRAKGFTVIQTVVLAELDGLRAPNALGALPLEGLDPAQPNEAYFRHVDFVVDAALKRGLFVGMLPSWGDKWNRKWGVRPEVFAETNAHAYGEFLGRRYQDKPNIIWILGGDRNPENDEDLAITRSLAAGLKAGDGGAHLMTYHPQGGSSSSEWFHGDAWLDFNMFQSGHGARDIPNYEMTTRDRAPLPAKPVLDGEPRYENHPIDWRPENGWFDDADARQAAYWSVFAGAAGHTYGCHDIWQFYTSGRQPISSARTPWREALNLPAAWDMTHLRALVESRPSAARVPGETIIVGGQGAGGDHVQACRDTAGGYALVYVPTGRPVTVRMNKIAGRRAAASWFDPRTGAYRSAGTFSTAGAREFTPPTAGRGQDWVLVLDRAPRRRRVSRAG